MSQAVDALVERAIREHWDFLPATWHIMSAVARRREIPIQPRPLLRPEPTDDYARNR